MNKRYLCTGNWIDKETGEPKSSLVLINEGKNKQTKMPYQVTDNNQKMILNETIPVGVIKEYSMVAVDQSVKK